MGKFKVGDRVRAVSSFYGAVVGNEYTVTKVEFFRYGMSHWVWLDGIRGDSSDGSFPEGDFEIVAPITIEAGKFYKTRDGRKVGPARLDRFNIGSDSTGREAFAVFPDHGDVDVNGKWLENEGPSPYDIVAIWQDEPTVAAPVVGKPKFKVGDRVYDTATQFGDEATVLSVNGNEIEIKWVGGTTGEWPDTDFELVTVTPSSTTPAIVALVDGQPLPSSSPKVHADEASASEEATRLASLHKGKKFGVFVLTQTVSEEVVYEHEWQRLAVAGLKIDAIKAVRALTGFGLRASRDGVEDWLARQPINVRDYLAA